MQVILASGEAADLERLSPAELRTLQFAQEKAFARQICTAPKGSPQRAAAIQQGYDTVCTILSRLQSGDRPLVMGFDARYTRLVLDVLRLLQARGQRTGGSIPRLFEIGYGSGQLLSAVAAAGYDVAGLEVSPAMQQQARTVLPEEYHEGLLLGGVLDHPKLQREEQFDVIYWNDVFEHIAPDEIGEYLTRIRRLLRPGGCLITITPNWHERPSDVTRLFQPPRTEACGLHLKEYTLREVSRLLRGAGFASVRTPLLKTPWRYVLGPCSFTWLKMCCEGALEYLPYWAARKAVRGLALSCTLAFKS